MPIDRSPRNAGIQTIFKNDIRLTSLNSSALISVHAHISSPDSYCLPEIRSVAADLSSSRARSKCVTRPRKAIGGLCTPLSLVRHSRNARYRQPVLLVREQSTNGGDRPRSSGDASPIHPCPRILLFTIWVSRQDRVLDFIARIARLMDVAARSAHRLCLVGPRSA
jgi:hypothetical protein